MYLVIRVADDKLTMYSQGLNKFGETNVQEVFKDFQQTVLLFTRTQQIKKIHQEKKTYFYKNKTLPAWRKSSKSKT